MTENKEKIKKFLTEYIQNQLLDYRNQWSEIQISKSNESKSSMGDKYETGRAMLHLEEEKLAFNLSNWEKNLQTIQQISSNDRSLVDKLFCLDDQLFIYFGIGLGQLKYQDSNLFCIALNAPIVSMFKDKNITDYVDFLGKKLKITSIE